MFLQLSHLQNTFQIISPDMTPQYGTEILAIQRTIRTLLWKIYQLLVDSTTPTGTWLINPAVRHASITTVFTGMQDYNFLKKIGIEKSNKMQQCIKIYYPTFIRSSTCFGRHIAHHQEPKTALAASGFTHVEGCWTCGCWTLSGRASSNLPRMQNQRLLVQF